jgi:hypothetical protein
VRRNSSYSFLTSALDEVSGQRHAPATFYHGNRLLLLIEQEAGWASELVWKQRIEEKSLPLPGIEIRSFSLCADTILAELRKVINLFEETQPRI